MDDTAARLRDIIRQFKIEGEFEAAAPLPGGHINDTFVSRWDEGRGKARYTHQRINDHVFARPAEVMENIQRVTRHIGEKLRSLPDRNRRVLTVIPGIDGKPWVRDDKGGWWRTYRFIENTRVLQVAGSPAEAGLLGKSIGLFQKQLADLPGGRLHETIPGFHNMETRYRRFYEALGRDRFNRAASVRGEIAFMRENEERGGVLVRAMRDAEIPERICHNDAKMNNILLDDSSGEALCVIDLDTVMPGTSLFDLGDLIRSAASGAREDEQDLALVSFDPGFFRAILEGYLSEASDFLVPKERELLAEAGRNITQIMALRFLTDYLEGDHYYRITRPDHNAVRCRNQIALIRSMDSQWADIQ